MTGFRAFHKEKKCYDTTNRLAIDSKGKVLEILTCGLVIAVRDVADRYDIEWETGAKDNRGVGIYQGDRLQADEKHGGQIEWVEWSEKEQAWVCENGLDGGSWLSGWEGVAMIIGTIHDEGGVK